MAAKRLVAIALLVGCAVAVATAAPEIAIRAHSQLVFTGIRRGYSDVYTITGELRDKLTDAPLALQAVDVTIGGQTYRASTDDAGRFAVQVGGLTGPQDVALAYPGGDATDGANLEVHGVDVDKQVVDLVLTTTPITGGVQVALAATASGQSVTVRTSVFAGAADADPTALPRIGELSSGATLNVTRAQAGGAGRRRIRAEFPGDAVYAAARVEATFELKTQTRTTLKLASATVAYEERVWTTGRVVDEDGAGVGRASVTLLTGDRHLAETTSRADGGFSFGVEAKLLGEGRHQLVAVTDPPTTFFSSRPSDPVAVEIKAPQPVPVAFTAAAFVATALVAGGFFLARSRPWDRRARAAPPVERTAAADDKGELKGGLLPAKPGLVSTLRRAADTGVSGTVRDAVRGRPIARAAVRLRLGAPGATVAETTATTDDEGAFALEDLAAGDWQAKASAPGHVSERFAVTIPHRGELRGVRIDLVPVREQVFAIYRTAAEPLLPEARLWGVWSPRQIVDHVRRSRPSPALADLTDFVEEAYFSARVPDEDILPAAQGRADRAIRERAPRHDRAE